jgi:hypothetical protein
MVAQRNAKHEKRNGRSATAVAARISHGLAGERYRCSCEFCFALPLRLRAFAVRCQDFGRMADFGRKAFTIASSVSM